MINITFKPKTMELVVSGHAGAGKKGKDIVCSAISVLFYTLGDSLMQYTDAMEKEPVVKDVEGEGYIACTPKKEYEANIALVYWTVLNGMQMVAEQYPKNVSFAVEE